MRTDHIFVLLLIFLLPMSGCLDSAVVGTKEGDRAPDLVGKAYNGSGWQNFDLSTYYDFEWSKENNNTTGSQWVMIEFLDTDCPYCFNSAEAYQQASEYFAADNLESPWSGPHISFIASAAELTGLNGHDSSREEIIAFRDKTAGEMCNSSNQDCSTRDGAAFQIPFIDDLDKSHMDNWQIGGTPTYFLIQPDGVIAWSSFEHQDEEFYDAVNRIVLQEYIEEFHPQNDQGGE